MAKGNPKSAVEQFVDEDEVTSLRGVISFSNAVLTDYVKGRMTKTDAVNTLHILETGPARHIHATIEHAAKMGCALEPVIGLGRSKQLVSGVLTPEIMEEA
jgi:hypothetical protein